MQGRNAKSAKPKNNLSLAISKAIRKIFGFFREVFHKLGELIIEAMKLLMEFFKIFTNILTHPTAGITCAVMLFLFVCTITFVQWVQIGVWLGSWLGIHSAYGIGAGLLGAALGVAVNTFQLTPEMYKIKKSWAIAYQKMGIKVDGVDGEETPSHHVANWNSIKHGKLARVRSISYAIECGLVLVFAAATGFQFIALLIAAISLTLPEQSLKLVSSMVSVLGEVSEHIDTDIPDPISFD